MGQPASTATERKRRALAVLRKAPLNSIPMAAVRKVAFRAPTAAQRARGKVYGVRAAELLGKPRKLAAA